MDTKGKELNKISMLKNLQVGWYILNLKSRTWKPGIVNIENVEINKFIIMWIFSEI